MREILAINPRPKRKKAKKSSAKKRVAKKRTTKKRAKVNASAKKEVTPMAKKRRTTRKAPVKRRRARSNPAPKPSRRRRAASYAKKTLGGMNIKGALKNVPPSLLGMFCAKAAAKRFGAGGTETDPLSWTWRTYLQAGAGALLGGFVAQAIKPGWGQKTLEGGINLMLYKLVQNEFVAGNATATSILGQPDYVPDEYMMGQTDQYIPGNVYPNEAGEPYLLGEDSQWYPVDDNHRLPETTMGDELEPVGPLGDELVPVNQLGDEWGKAFLTGDNPYREAMF